MQIIDLSVAITERTPVYPGDPAIKIEPAGVLMRDGYADHVVTIGTHVGTHIDAPMHMIEGGAGLDQVPVEQFVGHGKYIKVTNTFSLEAIKAANIQRGNIVLFHTGMDASYHETGYFEEYPVLTQEMADYLVQCRVAIVGFDTGSADNQDGFPVHKTLLGGGVLIIENLTNLAELDGREFMVYVLPIKLGIDGAPARVIAVIE